MINSRAVNGDRMECIALHWWLLCKHVKTHKQTQTRPHSLPWGSRPQLCPSCLCVCVCVCVSEQLEWMFTSGVRKENEQGSSLTCTLSDHASASVHTHAILSPSLCNTDSEATQKQKTYFEHVSCLPRAQTRNTYNNIIYEAHGRKKKEWHCNANI